MVDFTPQFIPFNHPEYGITTFNDLTSPTYDADGREIPGLSRDEAKAAMRASEELPPEELAHFILTEIEMRHFDHFKEGTNWNQILHTINRMANALQRSQTVSTGGFARAAEALEERLGRPLEPSSRGEQIRAAKEMDHAMQLEEVLLEEVDAVNSLDARFSLSKLMDTVKSAGLRDLSAYARDEALISYTQKLTEFAETLGRRGDPRAEGVARATETLNQKRLIMVQRLFDHLYALLPDAAKKGYITPEDLNVMSPDERRTLESFSGFYNYYFPEEGDRQEAIARAERVIEQLEDGGPKDLMRARLERYRA